MSHVIIPRDDTGATRPSWKMPAERWFFERQGVIFVCAAGHQATLAIARGIHAVAADGTVTPSVVCPADGCSFHEFVRLDGW